MSISRQEIVLEILPWSKDKSNLLGIKGCFYGSLKNHNVPDYEKPYKWKYYPINVISMELIGLEHQVHEGWVSRH